MDPCIANFVKSVRCVRAHILAINSDDNFCRTLVALDQLSSAIDDEFDVADKRPRKKCRTSAEAKLIQKLWYVKKKKRKLASDLNVIKGAKVKGAMMHEALVKVALAAPVLNGRRIRELLAGDGVDPIVPISHMSVDRIRDAFVETLKDMCASNIRRLVSLSAPGEISHVTPVFAQHIHDEASMRFRSYDIISDDSFGPATTPVFNRGRFSKVQNNVLRLSVSQKSPIEWFCELQPLQNKAGPTLASAIYEAVEGAMRACSDGAKDGGKRARFIHILTGDGVNTNENSAKRLVAKLVAVCEPMPSLQYRLIVIKCASHQSNLVVAVAVSGKLIKNPIDNCDLCGTLSRLYKYCIPSYLDEMVARLKDFVVTNMSFCDDVGSDDTRSHQAHGRALAKLYGDGVLPNALLALLTRHQVNGACDS